jgi:hypothetical protein
MDLRLLLASSEGWFGSLHKEVTEGKCKKCIKIPDP